MTNYNTTNNKTTTIFISSMFYSAASITSLTSENEIFVGVREQNCYAYNKYIGIQF